MNQIAKRGSDSAFPSQIRTGALSSTQGLTKREWFTGMIMKGMVANPILIEAHAVAGKKGQGAEQLAAEAVRYADMLLAKLEGEA